MTNVPRSLRGDLTKWMQEISVGVYVGNFNPKVREKLWKRVCENLENGNATLTYAQNNEIGYNFKTINSNRRVVDYEGIPLVFIPTDQEEKGQKKKEGFSKASQFNKARRFTSKEGAKSKNYVVIDIETDGLDINENTIIEIGAVKKIDGEIKEFQSFVLYDKMLPDKIKDLTGIRDEDLRSDEAKEIGLVLEDFLNFIDDLDLVGYGISFDLKFINQAMKDIGKGKLKNKSYDLLKYIKKEKMFLSSYKLENVLESYGIESKVPHRALEDAIIIYELSLKVNEFLKRIK